MQTRKRRAESHRGETNKADLSEEAVPSSSNQKAAIVLAKNNNSDDVREKQDVEVDKTINTEGDSVGVKAEEAIVDSEESTNNVSVVASSESTPGATNVQNPLLFPSTSDSNNLPKPEDNAGSAQKERSDSLTSKSSSQEKPHTRSRTRSLSSAVSSPTLSSLSGASGVGVERISRGPAKKRHKARALFDKNIEPESAPVGVTKNVIAAGRPRSNTIDSFRAAMDQQSNDLPTSSIVLPHIKQVTIVDTNTTKTGPSTRPFSSTIDFLNNSGGRMDPEKDNVRSSSAAGNTQHVSNDFAHGKTPKKTNRTRASSQSSGSTNTEQGPIRKRYRTRSLHFNDQDDNADLGDNDTANDSDYVRIRSNTMDSSDNMFYGRSRSDTMDFLTAAVAGDMDHDLDAASAAAAGEGASFAMHPISAPSGASAMYNSRRSRSNTIDSTASSLNSTKLDFLVSVAAEDNALLKSPERRDPGDSTENIARRPRSNTLEIFSNMASPRARVDTVDFLVGGGIGTFPSHDSNNNVLDHLQSLCDEPKLGSRGSGSKSTGILRNRRRSSSGNLDDGNPPTSKAKFDEETERRVRTQSVASLNTNLTQYAATQRLSSELLHSTSSGRRHRLESWGGMSDISAGGMEHHYSALRDTGLIDDIMAVAAEIGEESIDGKRRSRANSGGSNSSVQQKGRPRFDSIASLSLASLSDASISFSGKRAARVDKESASTAGASSIVVDFAAIAAGVDAANAAIEGLDLTAITGSKGTKASTATSKKPAADPMKQSEAKPPSSVSRTPIPPTSTARAAVGPTPMNIKSTQLPPPRGKPIHGKSHVPLPLAMQMPRKIVPIPPGPAPSLKAPLPFPVTSINIPLVPIPKSTKTKEEMDAIMQRARAAAGYTPPTQGGVIPLSKKAPPRKPPTTYTSYANVAPIPTYANNQRVPAPPHTPSISAHHYSRTKTPSSYAKARIPSSTQKPSTLQSQQKWEEMFHCLVKFIEDTRQEETKNLPEEKKLTWVWDGNVPTTYKTRCGKALGRWINNQRSAKSKGTLKDDREVRLVSTGLKWSVLTTNSWHDMLRELQIYVAEQTKDGRPWDGNVPTSYKIKSNSASDGAEDEEKNLGRWINRQRCLFQAGKLRKDRQIELERMGLKWSVLLTTSWTAMYDGLCAFAEARRKQSANGVWDGDVPPNYKASTNPPLSLGRWVNRQRSAYAKGQLKEDQVQKLEMIGLKWYEEGELVQGIPMSVPSSSAIYQDAENPLNETVCEPEVVTSSEC